MPQSETACGPADWPRDDSWLFADPMSIGDEQPMAMDDAWPVPHDFETRRNARRISRRVAVFALAGALIGAVAATGVGLLVSETESLVPLAGACPSIHSVAPDPAVNPGRKPNILIHG